MHTNTCLLPLALPIALRPHWPELVSGSPLMKDSFWASSIHVSRKGWHMLLNLCFHMAMTSAVFAGGITLTNYQMVCQAVSRIRGSKISGGSLGTQKGDAQHRNKPQLHCSLCQPWWAGEVQCGE
jgi:hypothetical protein